MPKTKVEVYDKDQLIYPYIESDHVTFSNGMKVSEMLDQSISMPTVIHEDLSFKVGVGDQDVSSAIVDSSVAEMTIKGKTYQNILPEPSTHVLTNNKEMFKVNEGLDPNVEIVDGVSKSAILKGQTLVNLVANPTHTFTQTSTINETWKQVNKYFTVDLQVGKTYIALWDMTWTNAAYAPTPTAFCFRNKDNQGVGRYSQLPSGKYYCKVTIDGSVPTPTMFRFHTSVGTAIENTLTVSNFIVLEYQEGMENWDIPYFEGLCDVKMPILRNVGKNLFDGELEMGGYTGSSGSPYESDIRVRSVEKIFLSKGTYTLSSEDATKTIFTIYNLNGVFKKEFISNNSSCTITLNEDCMVHICVENEKLLNSHIQLEQGSNVTSYEDHKANILRTSEEIVLREVNGVQDIYNPLTGEYVRSIGEIVLDGSEKWTYNSAATNKTLGISGFSLSTEITPNRKQYRATLCDKMPVITSLDKVGVYNGQGLNILIKSDSTNVDTLKEILAKDPITVQYELETPITTTIESLSIPFAYENGHTVLESGFEGQSLLPTLEYSTVINRVGQIQSIANTIQKQEKQITKLEQMLIQNIIDLDYNNTLLTLKNEMEEML